MAVRIREDGTIICAAKSRKRKGDTYLDDSIHYCLGVELRVMSVYKRDKNGADIWRFHSPISMKEKIKREEQVSKIAEE